MPCNLNFNQCNIASNYPRPIFSFGRSLISLLNSSGNQIINPTIKQNILIASVSSAQTTLPQGKLNFQVSMDKGGSIIYDNNGNFFLSDGEYIITLNINGKIAGNGNFSFALYENDIYIPSTNLLINGSVDDNVSVSNNIYIKISQPNALISVINTNSFAQTVNGGNITINKIL